MALWPVLMNTNNYMYKNTLDVPFLKAQLIIIMITPQKFLVPRVGPASLVALVGLGSKVTVDCPDCPVRTVSRVARESRPTPSREAKDSRGIQGLTACPVS